MRKQLRRLALFTSLTAATALGGQLAFADTDSPSDQPEAGCQMQHQGHKGHGGHRFFKRMAKALGLSDQQKAQAKTLFQNTRAQNKPLLADLMTARQQLRALVQSGSADETAIRAQSAKVAAAQTELTVKRAQAMKQFLALLTPEQVSKLQAIQAKRAQKGARFLQDEEAPAE